MTDHQPCKVLVVDDNHDCADTAAMLLETWGHAVRTAYTPAQATAAAAEFEPDVVLMDVGLPGKDGFEVAREIQALCHGCRIIGLTGFTHADIQRRAKEAGMNGCLVKPADPEVLHKVVEKNCEAQHAGHCDN